MTLDGFRTAHGFVSPMSIRGFNPQPEPPGWPTLGLPRLPRGPRIG